MPVFLFTDIEGSTALWERYGAAMAAALERHDALLAEHVAKNGGRILKHLGDGVFAVFENGDPLACTLDMQRELASQDWGDVGELRVRAALHAGEAERRGDDYFGPTVNRAHRLLEAGWGGQVLVTAEAAAGASLPPEATLKDLGFHVFKDLAAPRQVYQLCHPGMVRSEFPRLQSLSDRLHNLPPQPTPFLGREREVEEIGTRLAEGSCRLLTLVGIGGVGKTRLALQAAAAAVGAFAHGVYFIPLAALSGEEFLIAAVAEALGFAFYGREEARAELLNYLRAKEMLLVWDNFEHLVSGAAFVSEILASAPAVKVLATSRERLNVKGEHIYEVRGMEFPAADAGEAADGYDAVRLFVESARRLVPGFAPEAEDRREVIRICRAVEGLPLGIELAASWAQMLSLREIAAEVEKGLEFLASPLRDAPERHRSLRAVFEYSWGLLSPEEQRVLRRMAVFRGGFRREAAREVAAADLPWLSALVDKSLLRRQYSGRYEVPAVLTPFVEAKGEEAPEGREEIRRRHGEYYLSFLGDRTKALLGETGTEVWEEIAAEIENIRAAWGGAVDRGEGGAIAKAAPGLFYFYDTRGWFGEGEEAFRKATALGNGAGGEDPAGGEGPAAVHADVLTRRGWFCGRLYRYEEAEASLRRGLALFRESGSRGGEGFALDCLGFIKQRQGKYGRAEELYGEALAACEAAGDRFGKALALEHLGTVAYRRGEYDEAGTRFRESLALFEEVGYRRGVASSLVNLADVARARGAFQEARELCERSEAIHRKLGFRLGTASSLQTRAEVALALGECREARRLFREGFLVHKEIGNRWGMAHAREGEGRAALELGAFAEAEKLILESLATREKIGDPRGVASALGCLGSVAFMRGEYETTERFHEKALAARREIGEKRGIADSLGMLAHVALKRGGFPEARRLYGEVLALGRETDDRRGIAVALNNLGNVSSAEGEKAEAQRFYEESLAGSREIGFLKGISFALNNLGDMTAERGDDTEARRLFRESLAIDREMGYPRGITIGLHNLADLARRRGDYDEAQRLSEECYALCEKIGYQEGLIYSLTSLGQIATGRREPERAAAYFREGFAVALKLQAVPWALEILVGRAKSLVQGGDGEGAVELLATAASHPASEKENKKRAECLLSELRAELPPETFVAAYARGKAKRWEEWGES